MKAETNLNAVLAIKFNEMGKYSSLKVSKVVSASFDVIREINKLSNVCWSELTSQFDVYRQNKAYYRKYGGICPSNEHQLLYKQKLQYLNDVKKFILECINEIKDKDKWEYDIGYCIYIRELLDVFKEYNNMRIT